jgi:SPP1 family predicted phage head-tail adaptor
MVTGPKTTIVIERKTETRNTAGVMVPTWSGMRTLRGVLKEVSGREQLAADQMGVGALQKLYIQKPDGLVITESDRIRIGTTYRAIRRVLNLAWNQVVLTLEQGAADNE